MTRDTSISDNMNSLVSKAKDLFESKGLPDKKDEEYKYTNISSVLTKTFGDKLLPNGSSEITHITEFLIPGLDCYPIVFVNGKLNQQLSEIPESISVKSFDRSNPEDLLLGKLANIESNNFVSLNTSQFQEGLHIKVDKSAEVSKPVCFVHISDTVDSASISMPRLIIELGELSRSKFYFNYLSHGEDASFLNNVIEVYAGKGSTSSLIQIQKENGKAITHSTTVIRQERDSVFNSICITLGGKMVRNNLEVILDDENIESHLYGLYQLSGNQHVDNHTVVDHRKPNSNSNELYKGILNENATGVFNGKIYVRPDAQRTNAFQSNKNILLSDSSKVNTKPQLEIWADDVKCTHGCTTGQLDEEQIFYLQSRGISKDLAIKMVLKAFQHDIIDKIEDQEVIDYLDSEITKLFGGEM